MKVARMVVGLFGAGCLSFGIASYGGGLPGLAGIMPVLHFGSRTVRGDLALIVIGVVTMVVGTLLKQGRMRKGNRVA